MKLKFAPSLTRKLDTVDAATCNLAGRPLRQTFKARARETVIEFRTM